MHSPLFQVSGARPPLSKHLPAEQSGDRELATILARVHTALLHGTVHDLFLQLQSCAHLATLQERSAGNVHC